MDCSFDSMLMVLECKEMKEAKLACQICVYLSIVVCASS